MTNEMLISQLSYCKSILSRFCLSGKYYVDGRRIEKENHNRLNVRIIAQNPLSLHFLFCLRFNNFSTFTHHISKIPSTTLPFYG